MRSLYGKQFQQTENVHNQSRVHELVVVEVQEERRRHVVQELGI